MLPETILWRRLDAPGHDACRLEQTATGWQLDGAAVFTHEGMPARLSYRLACDVAWQTRDGSVRGWLGAEPVDVRVQRSVDGEWTVDGTPVQHLEDCIDLDFGFTPATNLIQLRRIALEVGQGCDVPVAWLDVPTTALDRLQQHYERRSAQEYWYEAPRFAYAALLEVHPSGFLCHYPGLWQSEP